jgi:hypothetical protein
VTGREVRQRGPSFVDDAGRQMILRGVNLGGDCKVPYPNGGTYVPTDFSDHREVSFIGRPFPIEEADEHLGRLAHWGFNLVRLLTTWEAVEHAGPGVYDSAYLEYLTEVCRRAGEHGLYVYLDFHQDAWSRMTGGDGAPGWTFEAVGLDFTTFPAAGAAHLMQGRYDPARGGRQDTYPQMSWGQNNRLPAAAIMWTLFWGGRVLTPQFDVEGRNVQTFLQERYLDAVERVAQRMAALSCVIGFDTLNEPGTGWIGERLSYRHLGPSEENPGRAAPGFALSPLEALAVAQGVPVTAPVLTRHPDTARAMVTGEEVVNPDGVRIWATDADCPFEQAGAYHLEGGRAVALDDNFFRARGGQHLDVSEHGFGPLFHRVAEATRRHNAGWSVFVEIDPYGAAAGRPFPRDLPERSVNASHWYDSATLYRKHFDPHSAFDLATGEQARSPAEVRERFTRQIAFRTLRPAEAFPGGAPSLLGEFGVPFDLDHGAAYAAWAAGERGPAPWSSHIEALTLMYDALDALLLHSAQWNYTASNRNDAMIGDQWNQEDLSIFSRDQQDDPTDPDSGGRAVDGFCRPYLQRTQGRLLQMAFHREQRCFTAVYACDPDVAAPTEIYVPAVQYPRGFVVRVEGPAEVRRKPSSQRVLITGTHAVELRVTVEQAVQRRD